MRRLVFLGIICFLLSSPSLAISGSDSSLVIHWTGNLNVFLGTKHLDEYDWEPVEKQDEFGIKFDFKQQLWSLSIAIDYLSSSGEEPMLIYDPYLGSVEFDIEGKTSELNLGVRKIWDQSPRARPFIGGGICAMNAEYKGTALGITVSDSDKAIGFWFGAGIYWTLGDHFNIGLEALYSKAEVTVFGVEAEAGGEHLGALAGYRW